MFISKIIELKSKNIIQLFGVWTLIYLNPLFNGLLVNIIFSIYIAFLLFIIEKYYNGFSIKISWNLVIILLIFTIIFLIPNNIVNTDLVADELYHSQQANSLAVKATLLLARVADGRISIGLIEVVRLLNILILIFFLAMFMCYKKCSLKLFNLIIFVLVSKLGLYLLHVEYGDPHPPLRLMPIWFFSTIFGINNISLRMSSTIALAILATALYFNFTRYENPIVSFILSLTVCTIPLLLLLGSIQEQSIYSILIWTLILLHIKNYESQLNFDYIIFLSSIGALIRSPVLVIFAPIILYFIAAKIQKIKYISITYLLPIGISIPYMYSEIMHKTPSTGEGANLDKIIFSLEGFRSLNYLIDNIGILWLIFIPLGFILNINRIYITLFTTLYIILIYITFYSINLSFFGHYKYQGEIAIPLIIIGFISLHQFTCKKYL